MKIQGAILDMDGTLLDSLSIWDTIADTYLEQQGIQPEPGLADTIKDLSMKQAAEYFQTRYGLQKSEEEIIKGINRLLEDFYLHTAPLKPGAGKLLEFLKEKNIRLVLATATDRYLAEAALKRCGVLDAFEKILTCSEVGYGKDEPQIFEEAARLLGTDRMNTMVFEDSLYAMQTAKQAGFPVAAVFESHEPDWNKVCQTADLCLQDLNHLEQLQEALT